MTKLKKLFNSINLNIEENKTVTKIENGIKSTIKCNNKPILIGINNAEQPLRYKSIIFNTHSKTKDCSYLFLEKYICEALSSKINFIVCTLLQLCSQSPEFYNQLKSQRIKQLLLKLIKDEIVDFNDNREDNLLDKWTKINNKLSVRPLQDGLIRLSHRISYLCIEDEEMIQYYKEELNINNDENHTFTLFTSYISIEFPVYNLFKNTKNLLLGIEIEKNDIEILKAIYQYIFKNIDKKDSYSLLDKKSLLKDKLNQNTRIEKIDNVDTELIPPTILLIETFNSIATHIDSIIEDMVDIDEPLIKNEKFNLNLTKKEIDEINSLNEFIPNYYFGLTQDLNNEIKYNPRIKFEEFNEQLNLNANKVNKQNYSNPPKISKKTYLSFTSPSTLLSLSVYDSIASVSILDPVDNSFNQMIPDEQRKRHTYILAGSGSGKTSLLETFLYRDCQKLEQSTIIFDLMGKATKSLLKFVEDPERLLIIDPYLHPSITPIINPFEFLNEDGTTKNNPSEIEIENRTNAIINAFDIALDLKDGWSVNMKAILAPCISTLLRRGNADIFELQKFMNDGINQDLVNLGTKSPIKGHRSFFRKEFRKESYEVTKNAISAKLQVFLNNPTFVNLVTGKSTINFSKEINTKGRIIIFKLPSKQKLFARLMMEMIQDTMKQRINMAEDKITPTHIYLDEFQNYLTPTIEEILSESRNYKFYVTFAHQSFVQLSKKMQGIVLSNSNIKIVGQCSYENGKKMAKEMKADFEMIETLDQGEFVFKVGAKDVFKSKNTDKFIKDKTPYHNKRRTRHMKHQLKNYYVYKELVSSKENFEINTTSLLPKHDEF